MTNNKKAKYQAEKLTCSIIPDAQPINNEINLDTCFANHSFRMAAKGISAKTIRFLVNELGIKTSGGGIILGGHDLLDIADALEQ